MGIGRKRTQDALIGLHLHPQLLEKTPLAAQDSRRHCDWLLCSLGEKKTLLGTIWNYNECSPQETSSSKPSTGWDCKYQEDRELQEDEKETEA